MELRKEDLEWYWFKGNEVLGALLQSVCLFRSQVLFDRGFRQDFSEDGRLFGDVTYADFESYHVVAASAGRILGTVRVTPPHVENVARSVLGAAEYKALLEKIEVRRDRCLEINRLMIVAGFRKLGLGRTLIYAAVALIETVMNRKDFAILASAGNCTKQADFCLKYTDYERIAGVPNRFESAFNDEVTFLLYKNPPYEKGREDIERFRAIFAGEIARAEPIPYRAFTIGENQANAIRRAA